MDALHRIDAYLAREAPPTPCVVVDLATIRQQLSPPDPVVLAGPTCDSTHIIYHRAHYELPLDLAIGDTVDFLSAGAYTASYASVEFNGFPPLAVYCI